MRRLINLKRVEARRIYLTYFVVIVAYVICQTMSNTKMLSSSMRGMLVPICAYMVMSVSLNLVVGILGELSLGHAGFMSVGAFSGVAAAVLLQGVIPFAPVRLAIAMIVAAIFAAFAGFVIGIPVLRLKGDYLAIVTLAFGEI
ncbi:MAG: branched-chain amino acid ABC transporter permease, partial [Synergistaceae bacterium]|nr:branched-chain amino acid ABC transporter permease [Synergistaceae bacterium]